MKTDVLFSPLGYVLVLVVFVAVIAAAASWQRSRNRPLLVEPAAKMADAFLPKSFQREGARFTPTKRTREEAVPAAAPKQESPVVRQASPLRLYAAASAPAKAKRIPFGRIVECELRHAMVATIDVPVIAMLCSDLSGDGITIRAGTEIHGRIAGITEAGVVLDPTWRFVGAAESKPIAVQAVVLPSADAVGVAGKNISARGRKEAKLFGATFLSAASAALQDTQSGSGVFGEYSLPAVTARNAALAGTSAVLRDYAREMQESLRREMPVIVLTAGTKFSLYLNQDAEFGPDTAATK